MRYFDFSSWQGVFTTLFGLVVITLLGVGIRLLAMQTIQQRRERENRQINERLRTLIAAYKVLGGSFTGNLTVDPTHLRDLLRRAAQTTAGHASDAPDADQRSSGSVPDEGRPSDDRSRRIRDAVEAALSDIILLGTEEQVRLAASAAAELAAGRPVHTAELVISLRNFIRQVLDLEAVPANLPIPKQGPTRPSGSGGKGQGAKDDGKQGGRDGGGGMGGGGMGGGSGMGGVGSPDDDQGMRR